ncbi:hypothetical protein ABDK00_011650 [Niabella insulamsoli]|uniref:hypothetical protein n=1 Tax=Niabella insulamsoli TaxID=3144874 RepID=UPI0031FDB3B7
MRNKIAKTGGFIIGCAGFLFIFKFVLLKRIPPSDEVAPGLVVLTSLLVGFLFSFLGSRFQKHLERRRHFT